MRLTVIIIQCFIIILCVGVLFGYSQLFTDPYIVPKWLFGMLIILVMGMYFSVKMSQGESVKIDTWKIGLIISSCCSLQAVYGLLQYFGLVTFHSIHTITGCFDNPAGFAACLCAGLPFAGFLLLQSNKKYIRYCGGIAVAIIVMAVVLSQSRAGIISIATICAIFLFQRLKQKRIWKCLLLSCCLILLFGCYWMKKDSADGRLLIWQCSINMVKEAPWTGHGIGGFEAHYMDYQADYFKQHERSRFSMLADNIKQPFNEYLGILLNFGIVGLLVSFLLIGAIVYCYKKNPTREKKIAFYSLISIGIFSLFSYPFTYPFVWIVAFLSIYIITGEYIKRPFTNIWIKNIICISVIIISFIGLYGLVKRIQAELNWNKASTFAFCRSYSEILPAYEILEKNFPDSPYFLYNYAAILQKVRQYSESLEVALKCRQYWADYDLELIIAENYQQLRKSDLAEKYYNSASMMCPSRFLPLYKMFYLYKSNNEMEKMLNVADQIINKPMKIKTSSILMMKKNVKNAIVHIKRNEYVLSY